MVRALSLTRKVAPQSNLPCLLWLNNHIFSHHFDGVLVSVIFGPCHNDQWRCTFSDLVSNSSCSVRMRRRPHALQAEYCVLSTFSPKKRQSHNASNWSPLLRCSGDAADVRALQAVCRGARELPWRRSASQAQRTVRAIWRLRKAKLQAGPGATSTPSGYTESLRPSGLELIEVHESANKNNSTKTIKQSVFIRHTFTVQFVSCRVSFRDGRRSQQARLNFSKEIPRLLVLLKSKEYFDCGFLRFGQQKLIISLD